MSYAIIFTPFGFYVENYRNIVKYGWRSLILRCWSIGDLDFVTSISTWQSGHVS